MPPDHDLPASLYLPSAAVFFTTQFGTVPWPPIEPDVTGGPSMAGHAHKLPAQLCYEQTPNVGGVLTYNANACY